MPLSQGDTLNKELCVAVFLTLFFKAESHLKCNEFP